MGKLSRSSSPLDHDYESYDNTRETSRLRYDNTSETVRLRTEYDMHTAPTPSEKNVSVANARTDRLIFRIRLVLRIISFLIATSIVVVLSYSVNLYRTTRNKDVEIQGARHGWRSVWVAGMKMSPTYVLLGVSCAATLLCLFILLANFSKAIRRVTDVSNLATAIVSAVGCILWIGVGAWYKSDDWNKAQNMDITSYVCRHQDNQAIQQVLGNMGLLCNALRYAWWAVLCGATIELFSMITVSWGVMVARRRGAYAMI